ncbi:MAG: hypothetical protein Q6360_13190 [Candidatus Brocadiales bacterium]|nr:hypothetical protein [Candidatus Brocadiales bacterium]
MEYTKARGGKWAKASEIKDGTQAKIVDECSRVESQFKDDKGNPKTQDVAKVRFEGENEAVNVSFNRATIYGLIDAYGADSKGWIGKVVTAHTEKISVAGKRVMALYLVPEGYEMGEDDAGYVVIQKKGSEGTTEAPDASEIDPADISF